MHPCEPMMDELQAIRKQLYKEASTDLNIKKIQAIEAQIARRKGEARA